MKKVLIAASTMIHIQNFHVPYIEKLKQKYDVKIMARDKDFSGNFPDFDVKFTKNLLSLSNLKSIFKVRKILKEQEFDVIFLNTVLAAIVVRLALKFSHLRKKPKVINIVHGYLFDDNSSFLKRWFYIFAEKFVKNQTDTIIVMNKYDKNIVYKYKLCKNDVKYINGMGVNDFRNKNTIHKTDTDYLKFCFIGELSKRKNQEFLIKFINKLNKMQIKSKLFLVGYGLQEAKLKKFAKKLNIQDAVIFVGYEKNIEKILPEIDYYISASKIEGSPFNIVEAMEFGKVIISANIKGCCDVLNNNVNGILFKPFSQKDAIDKFLLINSNEKLKDKLRKNAVKDSEKFLLREVFDTNLQLFISCIEK